MSENNGSNAISNSDSWVDLSGQVGMSSPTRITPVPPFGGEQDYLRMLREAQKESNRSSTKVSPISSALMSVSSTTRNSPSGSPKSPPNSPNPELADISEELKGVYINRLCDGNGSGNGASVANNGQTSVTASELIWDWSSRPNVPPRDWKLSNIVRSRKSSSSSKLSSNNSSGRSLHGIGFGSEKRPPAAGGYSKKIIYTLIITNLLSLLLGAGIGMWLMKSSGSGGSKDLIDIPI